MCYQIRISAPFVSFTILFVCFSFSCVRVHTWICMHTWRNDWIDSNLPHSWIASELYILSNFHTQYVQSKCWLTLAIQVIWAFNVSRECSLFSTQFHIQPRSSLYSWPEHDSVYSKAHMCIHICSISLVFPIGNRICWLLLDETTPIELSAFVPYILVCFKVEKLKKKWKL